MIWESLSFRIPGMIVLNDEPSTNRIHACVPVKLRCWRMRCGPILTPLFTDLFARQTNYRGSSRGPVMSFR